MSLYWSADTSRAGSKSYSGLDAAQVPDMVEKAYLIHSVESEGAKMESPSTSCVTLGKTPLSLDLLSFSIWKARRGHQRLSVAAVLNLCEIGALLME